MTTWLLYAILSNGEAGPVPVLEYVCRKIAAAVGDGLAVTVDLDDGSKAMIRAASCLGPVNVDPCNGEAMS